jgi:predicted acetyltransferase
MSSSVALIPAGPEYEHVLRNLLELYVHDLSELVPVNVGEDGRFGYSKFVLYWSDVRRHAFLAQVDGRWAGFALVKKGSEAGGDSEVWDMAEFFVLRRFRRRGVGSEMAESVWRLCPGNWEIRVMESNAAACRFWGSSIERFTGHRSEPGKFQVGAVSWNLFSFESKP